MGSKSNRFEYRKVNFIENRYTLLPPLIRNNDVFNSQNHLTVNRLLKK